MQALSAHSLAERAALIMQRCDELGAISDEPERLTRAYGTPALREALELVASWMRRAGLEVRVDAAGNLIAGLAGADDPRPVLMLGSHLDTVRDAGRYDGPLGVLTALACVEQLRAENASLPFGVEVVAFADEEGLRFGSSFLGSSVLAGAFPNEQLERTDAAGVTLREAIVAFGGDPEHLERSAYAPGRILAYCEVHIEQGPLLEHEGLPVGVVSAIQGRSFAELRFTGVAGHAGTVPMSLRHDALGAAAEFIAATETVARATDGLVATVGELAVEPGAANVIPGATRLTLDLRHPDDTVRRTVFRRLEAMASSIAASRAIDLSWDAPRETRSVRCDPQLMELLAGAVRDTGRPVRLLPSGAGHDAMVVARVAPAAMLFVRCAGGISHNPAESVAVDDVAVALGVLDRFVRRLAERPAASDESGDA